MKINYDVYNRPEPSKIYLAKPDHEIICCLNGIDVDSVKLTLKANNCFELSFDVHRYIDGVETDGYNYLGNLMRLHLDNIGWFIMEEPTSSHDGIKEIKHVTASSVDIEFLQTNLSEFKINCGTTDSREMLLDWNVEVIDGVEFAIEQIKFYYPEKPELSLLHILIEDNPDWSIEYVDPIPKVYTTYDYETETFVDRSVQLKDEIGRFEIDFKSRYAFITQDVAQYFQCIIFFDSEKRTISAYRVENIGNDTNINIAFRNIENSNNVNIAETIYTVYNVYGGDNLNINYWNFGSSKIENLDYYLNTKYMSQELITKYKAWRSYMESERPTYADYTKQYNANLDKISELTNRVPIAGCSTDWATFSDEELASAKSTYLAMKAGIESMYVDEHGNFDPEALAESDDANTYYQITEVILPSIEIEYDNRELPTSEGIQPYVETYKTQWEYYGVNELAIKMGEYEEQKATLTKSHYDMTFAEYQAHTTEENEAYQELTEEEKAEYVWQFSPHTKEIHTEMHNLYLEAVKQLDDTDPDSCATAYNERKEEVAEIEEDQETITTARTNLVTSIDKSNWSDQTLGGFTADELRLLHSLYNETNYNNENIFITSIDNNTSDVVGAEYDLLRDATESLEIYAQPQYSYTTELENLLALYEYKDWAKELALYNFIYLSVRDDYVVKLRVVEISYNPMLMDSKLTINFSNMLKSRSKRNDFVSLLSLGNGQTNSAVTSYGNNTVNDDAYTLLTQGLIEKILSSSALNSKINTSISNSNIVANGGYLRTETLDTDLVDTLTLNADNAFVEYMRSNVIVADSAAFREAFAINLATANLNADNITAGTLRADRLAIRGTDGLYYALNTDGETVGYLQTDENSLNGSHITAQSITADKIVVADLVAFDATIGGFEIGKDSISSYGKNSASDGVNGIYLGSYYDESQFSQTLSQGISGYGLFAPIDYATLMVDMTGVDSKTLSDVTVICSGYSIRDFYTELNIASSSSMSASESNYFRVDSAGWDRLFSSTPAFTAYYKGTGIDDFESFLINTYGNDITDRDEWIIFDPNEEDEAMIAGTLNVASLKTVASPTFTFEEETIVNNSISLTIPLTYTQNTVPMRYVDITQEVVTGTIISTSPNATIGIGSINGNHLIYDGTVIDLKTDWLSTDNQNHKFIVGAEDGTVVVGTDSGFHVEVSGSELGFYEGNNKVAFINNNTLHITQSVVLDEMQVGDTKWSWKINKRTNDIYLKWIG